jgi:8-oxo-dGTP pyrophosphatase MutT (NUDIX family)
VTVGVDADRLLPADLAERARTYATESSEPVLPRSAATIAVLRDSDQGVEIYLLRRVSTMAFASGMHVFPGGTVDPRDLEHAADWVGDPPEHWARRFGVEEPLARGLVFAAIRETFEESGVLLAGPAPDDLVADTSADDWEADRIALVEHRLGFADLLERRGLVARADLVRPWARWITPEFEPRRYDTAFFVAALPDGQRTRHVAGEADAVAWVQPAIALEAVANGAMNVLPPTAALLREISAYETVHDVLAAADDRRIVPITPRPVLDSGQPHVVLPGEPGYER